MPELTIKNKSESLVSLTIGKIGPGQQRVFTLSTPRIDKVRPELDKLRRVGSVEYWTDAAMSTSLGESDSLSEDLEAIRAKTAEIDALQKKASEIEGIRRGFKSKLDALDRKLRELEDLKGQWQLKYQELVAKVKNLDLVLALAKDVGPLVAQADRIAGILGEAEQVASLLEKAQRVEDTLDKSDQVAELLAASHEILALKDSLLTRVQTPLSELVSVSDDRQISCSQRSDVLVPDMTFVLPSEGEWLVSFESLMHSPQPSSGFISLYLNDIKVGERPTGMLSLEGHSPPAFMSEAISGAAGAVVDVRWRSMKGSIRMKSRKLTALKVSLCS